MADSTTVKMSGIDDLRRALAELPIALRKKVLLAALRKAARIPLAAARQSVPVMSSETAARTPYRTPGLLKRRLTVRVSKTARQAGAVGVFVNIKPAAGAKYRTERKTDLLGAYTVRQLKKASERGAKSPTDPYYWRFVEFGTKRMAARPYLKPATDTLPQALEVFMAEVLPQINRFNTRK